MEKQHNRGQDGAGVASIKLDVKPGMRYINRLRSNAQSPIEDIFKQIYRPIQAAGEQNPGRLEDAQWLKENLEFTGELFLGHLRYGTFGKNNIENLHPVMRSNNWMTRNLVLAGNFNMTNTADLIQRLVASRALGHQGDVVGGIVNTCRARVEIMRAQRSAGKNERRKRQDQSPLRVTIRQALPP